MSFTRPYLLSLLALLGVAAASEEAAAYQIYCNSLAPAQNISSVLGEPRDPVNSIPTRFHGGVDIGECDAGEEVRPIRAGTTRATNACTDGSCIRVVDSLGNAFDYVHLENMVSVGIAVTTSTNLGQIETGGTHLHLNEIRGLLGLNQRVNPQMPGSLGFNESLNNNPILVSTNIGSVQNQSIFLVPELTEPVTSATAVEPFEFRNSKYFIRENLDVFVSVREATLESRKGIYQIGLTITPPFLRSFWRIAFNRLLDSPGSTGDLGTLYYHRNTNSDTYIATNILLSDPRTEPQTRDDTWPTITQGNGAATFCVELKAFPGAQFKIPSSPCVNAIVDNAAPEVTITDVDNNPIEHATSSTTIKVVGTETVSGSGIKEIRLTGQSDRAISGVQATATETFSSLTDGEYTAEVEDLSGNVASVSFIIGRDQFLVEGRV